jgi:hypothetical protein
MERLRGLLDADKGADEIKPVSGRYEVGHEAESRSDACPARAVGCFRPAFEEEGYGHIQDTPGYSQSAEGGWR